MGLKILQKGTFEEIKEMEEYKKIAEIAEIAKKNKVENDNKKIISESNNKSLNINFDEIEKKMLASPSRLRLRTRENSIYSYTSIVYDPSS